MELLMHTSLPKTFSPAVANVDWGKWQSLLLAVYLSLCACVSVSDVYSRDSFDEHRWLYFIELKTLDDYCHVFIIYILSCSLHYRHCNHILLIWMEQFCLFGLISLHLNVDQVTTINSLFLFNLIIFHIYLKLGQIFQKSFKKFLGLLRCNFVQYFWILFNCINNRTQTLSNCGP